MDFLNLVDYPKVMDQDYLNVTDVGYLNKPMEDVGYGNGRRSWTTRNRPSWYLRMDTPM